MEIELTRIFVKVVQNGSFTRAAEVLRVPKSTVSKAVARLENETGTKLLVRTTRSLTLTASGRGFYESCLGPIQILEDARKSLQGSDSILSGTVRLTAPEDLGSEVIAPALADLVRRNPQLRFDLHYTDEIVDLVKDGFDLAVRIGKLRESSLRAKKIGEVVLILVASPAYLKEAGKIRSVENLAEHSFLSLRNIATSWLLRSNKGSVKVAIDARITCNQMSSLMSAAVAGAGIALVPKYLCAKKIHSGALVHVLPELRSPGLSVSLLSPQATAASARLKISGDHIFHAVQKALETR